MVLHTLVNEGRDGMAIADLASACERDSDNPEDIEEIDGALRILLDDDLAQREDHLYRPTRAAIRANDLSF